MEASLSKEEWEAHSKLEYQHGETIKELAKRVNSVEMAMFGDPTIPETVKNAILPTMTRLNTWLDITCSVGKVFSVVIITSAAGVAMLHTLGFF